MKRILAVLLEAAVILASAVIGLIALLGTPAHAVSSYTTCLSLQQPATGDQTNSWGTTVNTNWAIVDQALAGNLSIALPSQSGYPTVTLGFSQGATDQAKTARFTFTGTLTGATTVLWPNGRCGRFVVNNNTSGSFSTTLCVNNGSSACAGSSVVIPQGETEALYSDGTNVVADTNATGGGLTVNGTLTTTGAPTFGNPPTVPNGGTGGTTLTPHGVLVGEGTSPVAATGAGTSGQVLTSNGASSDPTFQAVSINKTAPQVTVYTSGSGTYTTPAGALYLVVEGIGGGGGGGGSGSGSSAGQGGFGGDTTFGMSFLKGSGGGLGQAASCPGAGVGGSATGGDINIGGISGAGCFNVTTTAWGGQGCSSPFGSGGAPGYGPNAGEAAATAGGSGGGGAGFGGTGTTGGGGGCGGYFQKLITSPAASYPYAVGAAGTAGTAGTSGAAGGAGASGLIEVTAYFE
jgi:hypothetical protein